MDTYNNIEYYIGIWGVGIFNKNKICNADDDGIELNWSWSFVGNVQYVVYGIELGWLFWLH